MNEDFKLKGFVEVKHFNSKGELVNVKKFNNLVVNVGKAQVSGLINGLVTTPFKYIAIGTGTTTESATDTALEAESQRVEATTSQVTTAVSNDTAQFVASFNFSADASITEYGLFDASTNGHLLSRKVDSAVSVHNGDTLQVTWRIQVQ